VAKHGAQWPLQKQQRHDRQRQPFGGGQDAFYDLLKEAQYASRADRPDWAGGLSASKNIRAFACVCKHTRHRK
jgi:hypothetical protein